MLISQKTGIKTRLWSVGEKGQSWFRMTGHEVSDLYRLFFSLAQMLDSKAFSEGGAYQNVILKVHFAVKTGSIAEAGGDGAIVRRNKGKREPTSTGHRERRARRASRTPGCSRAA